ncbi:MAG: heme-dependent oxidative N-demethylase subunit alpha family protein, partial [Candidatus Latescibacterota bacterium]
MDRLSECETPADGARYFPPASGIYDVKPGLSPLGTDFGNGPVDGQVFQFDGAFAPYRVVKEQARAERLGKYYQTREFGPEVSDPVCRFLVERLVAEHPGRFDLTTDGDGLILHCASSGETLRFDPTMTRVSGGRGEPAYLDPFDALAAQVQEDLAVIRRVEGRDWTTAIHLCFPYRWTAEEKIGLDFVTMHLPVPGIENFRRPGMVNI